MSTRIHSGMSTFVPCTFAEAQDGVLYVANGLDRPQRWDTYTENTEDAGIKASTTACDVTATTGGTIWGDYTIYTRNLDDDGIPSNFSLATTISITSGAPISTFSYSTIPIATDSRVTQREIWRNTHGQLVTWYLDQTISDNTSVSTTSARTDGALITSTALRYLTEDGWPNAQRFGVPPDWMGVVVGYQDRLWYSVPTEHTIGEVQSVTGTDVRMRGTRLQSNWAGRQIRVAGYLAGEIDSVSNVTTLTLTTSAGTGFGTAKENFVLSKGENERNRIYFSGPAEPESFAKDDDDEYVDVLELQDDSDRLRAVMPLGAYLFLLKERHIYRLSTAGDPRYDSSVVLVAERGCLNQRCWCRVEGTAFIMDRAGAYVFDGGATLPITGAVQDYWRGRINWVAVNHFSVEHSADEETVRFFVAIDYEIWPKHALCFNYRLKIWWLEEYPFYVLASGTAPVNREQRLILGVEEEPALISEGALDGAAPHMTHRVDTLSSVTQDITGTITSASASSISDTSADWDFTNWFVKPQDVGAPLIVVDPDGDYQIRRIESIAGTTITLQTDWTTTPSAGDTYYIGGIDWEVKLGGFQILSNEQSNTRRVGVHYRPQTDAGKLNLRKYYDFSSTADTAEVTADRNIGVVQKQGSANVQIDMTKTAAFAQHNFAGHYEGSGPAHRHLEIELKGVTGQEKTRIEGLDVDGVE